MLKSTLLPALLVVLLGCMLCSSSPIVSNLATGLTIVFALLIIRNQTESKS
ncbi:MAG: hypothetical protein KatS3mg032_2400 [Cyclobacteriaceae bacterium]|nr:MAG: hypothetical protein KatS3mg032_2400 [Cyclobacteriaceae bacterium]